MREKVKYQDALKRIQRATTRTNEMEDPAGWLGAHGALGAMLFCMEKYSEAEAEHRTVFKPREKVLGWEYLDTLKSRIKIAAVLHAQSKHAEAESKLRAVLTTTERILGTNHPTTAKSRAHLKLVEAKLKR